MKKAARPRVQVAYWARHPDGESWQLRLQWRTGRDLSYALFLWASPWW